MKKHNKGHEELESVPVRTQVLIQVTNWHVMPTVQTAFCLLKPIQTQVSRLYTLCFQLVGSAEVIAGHFLLFDLITCIHITQLTLALQCRCSNHPTVVLVLYWNYRKSHRMSSHHCSPTLPQAPVITAYLAVNAEEKIHQFTIKTK